MIAAQNYQSIIESGKKNRKSKRGAPNYTPFTQKLFSNVVFSPCCGYVLQPFVFSVIVEVFKLGCEGVVAVILIEECQAQVV